MVLLQRPEDRWRAWELGETHRYRYFIVADRGQTISLPPGSALSVVDMDPEVPDWIRRNLAGVQLVDQVADGQRLPSGTTFVTRDGFMRERRGGRSIAVANGDFMLGMADGNSRPAARRTRDAGYKRKPVRCREQIRTIESERQGIERRLAAQRVRLDYETRAPDHAQLQADYSRVCATLEELTEHHEAEHAPLERLRRAHTL